MYCVLENQLIVVYAQVCLGVRVATALIFQFSVVELASKITSRVVLKLF